MNTILIDQLRFHRGVAKCKSPDGSWQKAHYRQGELDGACGAYSIAMAMNLLGIFEADQLNDIDKVDRRTRISRLVYELDRHGLYSRGLTRTDIKRIVNKTYKNVIVHSPKKNADDDTIFQFAVDMVKNDIPVLLLFNWGDDNRHWVVVVGYEYEDKNFINALITLDPVESSPVSVDNLPRILIREGSRKFRHNYICPEKSPQKVQIEDAIAITVKYK